MSSPDPLFDAPWWILFSVCLDKLDGTSARLLKAQSQFGLQLDSFADFLSFGVAPAVVSVKILRTHALVGFLTLPLSVAVAVIYAMSTYARLKKFNSEAAGEQSCEFRGMPSTLSGAIFGTYVLTFCGAGSLIPIALLPPLMLALGYLMTRNYRGWKPHPASGKHILFLQGLLVIFIYWSVFTRTNAPLLFAILFMMYFLSMSWLPATEDSQPENEGDAVEEDKELASDPGS